MKKMFGIFLAGSLLLAGGAKDGFCQAATAKEGRGEKANPAQTEASHDEEGAEADLDSDIEEGFHAVETLTRAMELIRENYVDDSKLDYDRLISSALRGMLEDLDPHCQYLSPQVFEQMKLTQDNTYEGVGITVSPRNNDLVIVSIREDGPAARAGILTGDQLVKLNDTLARKLPYIEAVKLLNGKPGEKLKLTVFRPQTKETKEYEMVREVMRQDSVRDAMLLDSALAGGAKIGYVRILQFNAPTATELADALDALEEKGMKGLILDLRNNPGGLLTSSVDVAGEFLPPETFVCSTEGRVGGNNRSYKTGKTKRRERKYPLVVLINFSSASGAELTAGALQDLKRAVIVGETSFGKGSVQTILPQDGGTAIRLTTAKYFTPAHKPIHERGIEPDIVATLTPQEEERIFEWRRTRTQGSADPKQLAKIGDRQLERAVGVVKSALVARENK